MKEKNTAKIIIRKAKLKDIDELIRIEKKYIKELNKFETKDFRITGFVDEKLKKLFKKKILKKRKLFLVLSDKKNKLYGYMFAEISKNRMISLGYEHKIIHFLYLENVFIDKKIRGQGYFFKFENEIINFAKKNKIKTIELHVSDHNKIAKNIYEKMGFESREKRMRLKLK